MQKIMFNDDLGLTAMVLCKLKPITRREPIYYDGDIETCIIDGKLHIYKDNRKQAKTKKYGIRTRM